MGRDTKFSVDQSHTRLSMSRTIAFGRDVLGVADIDLEDLLTSLSGEEVQSLVDEMASDPDDKHLPASVRNSYRCSKEATGKLNRDSLITFINEEGIKAPAKEEVVPFELGKKRGKVFVKQHNEAELEAIRRAHEVAEAVRLDDDEEEALGGATTNDLMALSEILDANPQEFIMEAYADPLKYYEPDPANTANVLESISKVKANDKEVKDLNLNNIKDIKEDTFVELFDALKHNDNLVKLSAVNCDVNDFACATLNCALEQNQSLKSINLESNRIAPDTLAGIFEALTCNDSGIVELHLSNQAQSNMGYRVESRIADAICKNKTLVKVGLKFQFGEVYDRVMSHLIENIDRRRKDRVKNEGPAANVKWKPAKTLD